MPSATGDSHRFLKDAAEKGAVAAIVHSDEGYELALSLGLAVAQLGPEQFDDSIWRLALAAFGDPGLRLRLIGITGTNGKTTTAWIIRDLLNALGVPCGYLGTLGFQTPSFERELANTTPFPIELYAMLHEAADSGCKAMAIEISSHALAQHRADGISFEVVAFTNLSQDHLDFLGNMADYEAAKLRLFSEFDSQIQVINIGDEAGQRFVAASECPRTFEVLPDPCNQGTDHEGRGVVLPPVTASQRVDSSENLPNPRPSEPPNAFNATPLKVELTKLQVAIEGTHFEANLGGDYNVENCVAAYAIVRALSIPVEVENAPRHDASGAPRLATTSRGAGDGSCTGFEAQGFSPEHVCQAMAHVRPVPGRFEPVRNERNIGIIVDYAHTPDALTKLLQTARPL
ncbi:MAG: Mur ligase family protein, partial [Fimbriimonadaceae bacterium]